MYDYLFQNNILQNNIILYKIIQDDDFLDNILVKTDNFLEFAISSNILLEKIFKRDPLFIYNIIDFFKNNEDIIERKRNYIKELLNENNMNLLNYFMENMININEEDSNKMNIYKNIILKKDYYFAMLFNQIWLNNYKNIEITNANLILMAKQILILYYYNEFYNKNNIDQIMFDEELYQDFLKLLVKYKGVYAEINNENIILKTFDETPAINENKLKIFYKFCISNNFINKNLLSWFFVLFYNELPKYLYNDFYYIILGVNHNILGVISKILNYVGIDLYKYDKAKFNDLVAKIEDNHDYLGKIYDNLKFDNKFDYEDITNNIYLIQRFYEIYSDIYTFLYDINLNKLETNQYYLFILTSPLDNSFDTSIYSIKNILPYSIDLVKIYNSVECKNFVGNCIFLTEFGIKKIKNIEKNLINKINTDQININLFDKYINFINILNYLSKFEIIPYNTINLPDYNLDNIIENYLILFPKERQILHNYGN